MGDFWVKQKVASVFRTRGGAEVGKGVGTRHAFGLSVLVHEQVQHVVGVVQAAGFVAELALVLLEAGRVVVDLPKEAFKEPIVMLLDDAKELPFSVPDVVLVCERGGLRYSAMRLWGLGDISGEDDQFSLGLVDAAIQFLGLRVKEHLETLARWDDFGLTKSEIGVAEVLDLSDEEIRARLVIEQSTLEWYRKRIYRKLGVHCRREAIEVLNPGGRIGLQSR
jgi:DNA-binding CsgD family transcriptional regulator